MLAGCLYAFSGFSIYNIFFNHFWTLWRCFPICWRRWTTRCWTAKRPLSVLGGAEPCQQLLLFAGQAVFLILYFFCMAAGRRYKIGPRKFASLAWETVLGCAQGACCCFRRGCRFCKIRAPSTRLPGMDTCSTANLSSTVPFLQPLFDAGCALFQGYVPGRHPQTHEPDRLPAAGGCGGRVKRSAGRGGGTRLPTF